MIVCLLVFRVFCFLVFFLRFLCWAHIRIYCVSVMSTHVYLSLCILTIGSIVGGYVSSPQWNSFLFLILFFLPPPSLSLLSFFVSPWTQFRSALSTKTISGSARATAVGRATLVSSCIDLMERQFLTESESIYQITPFCRLGVFLLSFAQHSVFCLLFYYCLFLLVFLLCYCINRSANNVIYSSQLVYDCNS